MLKALSKMFDNWYEKTHNKLNVLGTLAISMRLYCFLDGAEHVGFLNKEASYILAELAAALMGLDIQPEDNQSDKRKLALHYAS